MQEKSLETKLYKIAQELKEQQEDSVSEKSPYPDEVMEAVRQQKQTQAAGGRHRAATAKHAANGRFTSGVQVAEQSISKQSKAATDADGEESGTKHIRTYGKESAIFSLSDAKAYFSNVIC